MASISSDSEIIITGADKGIGFEIAKQLVSQYRDTTFSSEQRCGAGREGCGTLKKEGLSVEALTIDVADDRSVAAAAQTVKSKFSRLDILINNVLDGFTGGPSSRALFEQTFSVNVFGAASTTEAFVPLLEKSAAASCYYPPIWGYRANPTGPYNFVDGPSYRLSFLAISL
ncbi:hypothetical protein B0H17DRAFT_948168 [Mycena rosella]|uniref:Uncharacterized protein n=1 Tax=Mycena rosella TaxID=1033263 RepID=A0AAD7D3B1_MYCRO|nr:hypothetical protein B0H17DRAFT_948168 [Mycena rosella]